ncbi:MAG: HAMP domain-containing histidine kinase, partial [Flavobacteriales bacterium]|nr:HAMP domain-containing histidine kinase [Flavobacteriales bacterium]
KAILAAYDLYRTRIDLVEANADLSKAYNELDQMVYSTAHDITGPLANILGLVDLVRRDPGATEEYLLLVEKAVRKLQLIAKEVINFHRNKRTPVEQQSINFKKLIENAIQDYAFFEGAEEIDFDIQIHANSSFESDKERIKIIFNNLISNAIKYRDRHKDVQKVEILVSTDALGAHITVSDNGLGIAEEVIPRIFDIYYRASAQSTGSGIGLYIVREVITLLSGKIEVSSIDGTGTTFRLFIPRTNTSGESK